MKGLAERLNEWLNGLDKDHTDWPYSPYYESGDHAVRLSKGQLIPAEKTVAAISRGLTGKMSTEAPMVSGFSKEEKRNISLMRDAERESIGKLIDDEGVQPDEEFPF
jgi:hypothetical protein